MSSGSQICENQTNNTVDVPRKFANLCGLRTVRSKKAVIILQRNCMMLMLMSEPTYVPSYNMAICFRFIGKRRSCVQCYRGLRAPSPTWNATGPDSFLSSSSRSQGKERWWSPWEKKRLPWSRSWRCWPTGWWSGRAGQRGSGGWRQQQGSTCTTPPASMWRRVGAAWRIPPGFALDPVTCKS